MKRGLFYFFVLLSVGSFSQTINPFNLDYVDWEIYSCNYSSGPPSAYNFNHYKLSGDTVYLGQTYKRIMFGEAGVAAPFPGWIPSKPYPQPSSYSFYGFYKQDSVLKRTYLRLPSWSNDSLLMDYNLQVGDTVKRGLYYQTALMGPTPITPPLTIIATDSILVGGHKFRILYTDSMSQFYNGQNYAGYFFVEGLGHINGVFEYWQNQEYYSHPFENCAGVDTVQLNAGALGITKFDVSQKLEVFPVPVADKLSLNFDGDGVINIYNSVGEISLRTQPGRQQKQIDVSALRTGIYFVELITAGKRFSAKFIKQ